MLRRSARSALVIVVGCSGGDAGTSATSGTGASTSSTATSSGSASTSASSSGSTGDAATSASTSGGEPSSGGSVTSTTGESTGVSSESTSGTTTETTTGSTTGGLADPLVGHVRNGCAADDFPLILFVFGLEGPACEPAWQWAADGRVAIELPVGLDPLPPGEYPLDGYGRGRYDADGDDVFIDTSTGVVIVESWDESGVSGSFVLEFEGYPALMGSFAGAPFCDVTAMCL